MRLNVEVKTLRELVGSAGLPVSDLARRLGLSDGTVSLKLRGDRPFFLDEIEVIVAAIAEAGRTTVTKHQVIKLIGRHNLKEMRMYGRSTG